MQDTETGHNNPSRSPLRHLSSFPWGWAASPQPAGWRPLFAHPQHCPKKAAQDRAATVPKSWRGHQPPPVVEWLEQHSPMTSCRSQSCFEHSPAATTVSGTYTTNPETPSRTSAPRGEHPPGDTRRDDHHHKDISQFTKLHKEGQRGRD